MKIILYILSILVPLFCFSQEFNFQFEPEAFPVEIDGWQPFCPWVGGDSETAPEFCDIDADGDLDLFVGSYWGTVSFIENDGTVSEPDFDFITKEYAGVNVGGTIFYGRSDPVFVDIDNDGDKDLFTSDGKGMVHYWENQGTAQSANFFHITDSLEYIDELGRAHLDFVDIDSDDDYDMFIGDNIGRLNYYENIGTPDSFDFEEITSYFDSIDVGAKAAPCFVDIDFDNDFDLFIGDAYGHIHYYRNDGDSVQWDYTLVSDNFMGIDVGDYASPEFADVDGDGDYDMFVGREATVSNKRGNIYYYENVGDSVVFQFELVTKNYVVLDLGYNCAFPRLVDINGDGKLDFFSGSSRTIYYFENTGTVSDPSFSLVDENFQGITIQEMLPWFVDIDADGDYDLICGESEIPGPPEISLYINRGTPEEPDIILYDDYFVTNPDFDLNLCPSCADIDADGDYDLFITDDNGYFYFYRNDGDAFWPDYTYVTNQWQGIYFPYDFWRGSCFGDLDGDGDLDLLMRNDWDEDIANIRFYRNIGTINNPVMEYETNIFLPDFEVFSAVPYLVDIDNDIDLDLFVGEVDGGIMFFRNLEVNSVNREPGTVNRSFSLYQNYPNPFNASTIIPFTIPTASKVKIEVYNLLGQKVAVLLDCQRAAGSYQLNWDASAMSSGVYLIMLETPGTANQARKVMLVK